MKSNKGMSLVELIIAIAMLAMVMTAVVGLMSSNTLTFRKQKADVFIQNTAQETYNRIADAIMQAKVVEMKGYTLSGTPVFSGTAVGEKCGFSATPVTLKKGKYSSKVSGDKKEFYFQAYKKATATDADDMFTEVYLTELKIKYSVPLEVGGVPAAQLGPLKSDTSIYDNATGKFKPGANDICTATYTFNENVVSIKLEYDIMTKYNTDTSDPDNLVFTDCLNFTNANGTLVPGVKARIDAENGAIGLDMFFAQRTSRNQKTDESYPATGMEYISRGMINIRNSFVLMDAN